MRKTYIFFPLLALLSSVCLAQQSVSIDDIYTEWLFWPDTPDDISSLPDGEHYSVLSENKRTIVVSDYRTGKENTILFDLDKARGECNLDYIEGYKISPTAEYILFYGNIQRVYRRSFTADHYIYDISHNSILKLSAEGAEQEADFAPNGYMISYIKGGNIKIYKLKYQSTSAVTTDGLRNQVINGLPDWVNEEEFSTSRSYAWSPDSRYLAYVRYDESRVKEYFFPLFDTLYPENYTFKYPKAGEQNSAVSVKIYDVNSRTTKDIDLEIKDHYIPRICWTGQPDQLAVFKLNRLQNKLDLLAVNAKSTVVTPLYSERSKRYIEEPTYTSTTFIHDGQDFIVLSEQDGWSHLYLYGANGVLKQKLTDGNFDVTKIYGVNEQTNTLYYQAAKNSPLRREIYSVNLKTFKTADVATRPGTNDAQFSVGCKYILSNYSSVNTPNQVSFADASGKPLRTYADNTLSVVMSGRKFSPKEFFTFTTSDGTSLNGWIVKPSDFSQDKKYPVLMVQYSGPNSQEVLDEWGIGWEQTLVANGVIVACVDPRGTGCRGEDFRKCTYLNLGKYECSDQIEAAEYLGSFPYVDKSQIGIWGWSFGGFVSSYCVCKSSAFKFGIAVAPVVDWRFYDTVYSERYMSTPELNPQGYANCPLSAASNLQADLLLVHGTADDNVHFQNQMAMTDALVDADKNFEMLVYPNRNHSIVGGNARAHVYKQMLRYVLRQFNIK